jgi:hypothetical protein
VLSRGCSLNVVSIGCTQLATAVGAWKSARPRTCRQPFFDKLNKEINAGLVDPKIKARLAEFGRDSVQGFAADFRKLVVEETENLGKMVNFAGSSQSDPRGPVWISSRVLLCC